MKLQAIFCVLMVTFLISCKNETVQIRHGIIDSTLAENYNAYDKSINLNRSVILFSGESSANNCNTYLKLTTDNMILESINNQLVKSEYLVCDALKILSGARNYTGKIDINQIGADLKTKLDIRSFPNSLARMTEDNSYTLEQIFPSQSFSRGASVVYDSEDWFFTLQVVAVVNINNNSHQDWIIQLSDESKSGNYRNYATLVVYDPKTKEILQATSYP